MRTRLRSFPLLAAVLLLCGCRDQVTGPDDLTPSPGAPAAPLGVMEVTISGIGTPQMTASAHFPGAGSGGASLALSPLPGSDGTIEIAPLSSGSFTSGARGAGGVRYVQATFRVRNADQNGVAYGTARQNLTFLGASTASTMAGSAVRALRRFDGSSISDGALAAAVVPTGPVYQDVEGRIASSGADALQVLTEAEAASFTPTGTVTGLFPYGFVVRRAGSSSTRTLPASPAPGQYDGLVTFAFRLPLQATAAQDVYSITITFLAVDDSETRVTQSLQEQSPLASAAVRARAAMLAAAGVRVLPGGSLDGERICTVRTAGTAVAPTAYMVNATGTLTARSPTPYAGGASFVPASSSFSATYDQPVTGQGAQTFVVNGSQSGRFFLSGGYTNDGAGTIATPAGLFFPGEEVDVVLTGGIVGPCDGASVVRYRVAAATASAVFTELAGGPIDAGSGAHAIAPGDFDEDGAMDFAVTSPFADSISVFLGDGSGGFARTDYPTAGCSSISIATGDLDGDGHLDLTTANLCTDDIDVMLGDGNGAFAQGPASPVSTGLGPIGIALGDLNADGVLDLVTANVGSADVTVLLGDGSAGFTEATGSPFDLAFGAPSALAIADLDNDGRLDLALTDSFNEELVVFLGDGAGGLDDSCTCGAPITANPIAMAVGDLNGDGDQDVVVGGDDGVTVLLGDGTGAFVEAAASPVAPTLGPVVSVAIGDLNGDGDLDLAAGDYGAAAVDVLLGDGAGGFTAGTPLPTVDGVNFVAIADLDDDGRLDVVASTEADQARIYTNGP